MKRLRLTLLSLALTLVTASGFAANIVCLTVEDPDNYDSPNFLRGFAERELRPLGHKVTIISGEKILPTRFDGFRAAMKDADLLIVFVRRATPPKEDIDAIRAHLAAGKPLVGIRTANHGFVPPAKSPPLAAGLASWPEFVPDVLGCQNTGYETKGLPYKVSVHPAAPANSPLLAGVNAAAIKGHQSLYKVLPLAPDAKPLLLGTAEGHPPAQPLAWTRNYGPKNARIFYTSLGGPFDVTQPDVRRLILNGVNWSLGR